ncbi:polyprenyl synthetase family protein [Sansalvadorimonas verongulae]|uniref:polyprenyl synthetase family protein n=1 Tax=Sansalvadorimonas verongulae TaxID=2172824 RepID=UPI0012BD7435|nr:farnesyl diphosphate synthase [Sansalvadorimonas verongulae]MTI14490.1 polyprenyl synthetase family protein [Sansalvadorimonas verongulae]
MWTNQGLQGLLQKASVKNDMMREAMAYSTLAGGKRVRPMLVRAVCEALGGDGEKALPAACALELVHTYSLIHDDLPAMDDDDLRRGRPTCHKAFDEATAILTGDALLTLAFAVLADNPTLPADVRIEQTLTLARAAGCNGMIEGQARDMQSTGKTLTLEQLKELHNCKTGALIRAACTLGALAAGATAQQTRILESYAEAIGLAFQVQDDILDVTASTEVLGKTQGADIAQGKNTYVSLLGLEGAQATALELRDTALKELNTLSLTLNTHTENPVRHLQSLANYIVERDH